MNIGEKIKELRLAKLMTQSELAGSHITRNMLSCIENGSAQPSLSTVIYIAGRLGVPAGFLLAEAGDEFVYRKMNAIANIKRAYIAKDWQGCRSLCLSACPEPDDEISLLLAECAQRIGVDEFWHGRLHSACRFFDEALFHAEKTVYTTAHIEAEVRVFFRFMQRISTTLYSNVLDAQKESTLCADTPFSHYVDALDFLEAGEIGHAAEALARLQQNSFFYIHLHSKMLMDAAHYEESKAILEEQLHADHLLNEVELYAILSTLELCCRETEDYKGAYRYATERVQLLQQLLCEI